MQLPLQITFRNMESSEALEASIRKFAAKLEQEGSSIMSCRVVVEAPANHKQKGGLFHTRLDITVPGGEIVINRKPDQHHSYVDVYVSIRDAFKAAKRRLSEHTSRRQGKTKAHESVPCGQISTLVPEEDYGRIETSDGRDLYFHRNSILGADFDKLKIGQVVSFAEGTGDEGPQASTVRLVGKHRLT